MEAVPVPVQRALATLGEGLSLARRRRRFTQDSFAERIGASRSTVRRMETGDIRVPIGYWARAFLVLGDLQRLAALLDTAGDDIGLMLMDEQVPKRVRRKKATTGAM